MSDTVPATTTSIPKPSARRTLMDLYLRKVVHPQARDNYRVILKDNGLEIEIGSIGIQHGSGATEAVGLGDRHRDPMRETEAQGIGKDRRDCMRQFGVAWDKVQL
jgi:hypothetical protein